MTDFLEGLGSVLADAGKGAAAGAVLGPFGAAGGALINVAMNQVPGLQHLINGNASTIAAAEKAVANMTGTSDPTAAQAALDADPGIAADLQRQLAEIANDGFKAQLADVANARATTVQLASQGSSIAWGAPVISITIVVAIFIAFGALLWRQHIEDAGVSAMVNMIVGAFVLAFGQVARYWLGGQQQEANSAASSARKTELLGQSMPAAALPKPLAVVPAAYVQAK